MLNTSSALAINPPKVANVQSNRREPEADKVLLNIDPPRIEQLTTSRSDKIPCADVLA
jgi:hypothetical protein